MPRLVLLSAPEGDRSGHAVVNRFLGLLERGWDVHLVLDGSSQDEPDGLAAADDSILRERVHPPPFRLRGGRREGLMSGLRRSLAHSPVGVPREILRERSVARRYARAVVAALRPDILHVLPPVDADAWTGLGRAVGARVVAGLRWDQTDRLIAAADGNGRRWKGADAVHLDSEALARLARERAETDVVAAAVPPGPDSELLAAPTSSHRPEGPLRVLAAGPLSWTRGYEHALRAVRLLIDDGGACTLRIVGQGEYADAVAFARYQLELTETVEVRELGEDADLREHLLWADVLLNAAVVPTSPKPLLDGCALGRPHVTTESFEPAPIAAATVPRRDPDAIARELASLSQPETLRRAGEVARRQASELAGLDYLDELERLYRRALGSA